MIIRKLSFAICIVGIAILLSLLLTNSNEVDEVKSLELNEKVMLTGSVANQRQVSEGLNIMILEGHDFDIVCDCDEDYLGSEIVVEGVVEEFNGEKQVRVLKIVEKK
jgi:hypothetical protein